MKYQTFKKILILETISTAKTYEKHKNFFDQIMTYIKAKNSSFLFYIELKRSAESNSMQNNQKSAQKQRVIKV